MTDTIIKHQGDGKTKTFRFGFSFFDPADIVVEINGAPATIQYALQIGKPNKFADIPYTGGTVNFAVAPGTDDEIKIYRKIALTRPVDYQETAQPAAHEMNQDSNFHLECHRDLDSRMTAVETHINNSTTDQTPTKPTESNTPNTQPVDMTEIENKFAELKNTISELNTRIESCATTSDINKIQSDITALGNRIENIDTPTLPADMDYVVVDWHSDDGSSWYRKYKSGWVEQGGSVNAATGSNTVSLPITMANNNYNALLTAVVQSSNARNVQMQDTSSATELRFICNNTFNVKWYVCGLAQSSLLG